MVWRGGGGCGWKRWSLEFLVDHSKCCSPAKKKKMKRQCAARGDGGGGGVGMRRRRRSWDEWNQRHLYLR
jgi:hypothetical protein